MKRQELKNLFDKIKATKTGKITKLSQAYKSYASTCNIENLNSFNHELQVKDTESTIRNKIKHILTEL